MHRYLLKFLKSESQDILRAEGLPCVLAWFQTRVLLSAKSSIPYLAIVNKGFVNEKYFETCPMSTVTESESSRYLTAAAQAT